jgi:hypothetical protein
MVAAILHKQLFDGIGDPARRTTVAYFVACSVDTPGFPWNLRTISCIISRRPRTRQGARGTDGNGGGRRGFAFLCPSATVCLMNRLRQFVGPPESQVVA